MEQIKIDPDADYVKISEQDLQELELLRQKLEAEKLKNADPTIPIKNLGLKVRVGKLLLKLLVSTPNRELRIRETCSRITGAFSWHTYGDELDEAIKIAKELEDENRKEEVYEKFKKMNIILEEYTEENSEILKKHMKKKKD
jgi:hypothetical protein